MINHGEEGGSNDELGENAESLDYDLEEWVEVVCRRRRWPSRNYIVIAFPTDDLRESYLSVAAERDEQEVRAVLRTFLGESRHATDLDYLHVRGLKWLLSAREAQKSDGWRTSISDYETRALLEMAGRSREATWPSLTWVLDLLPHWPRDALSAIRAFTLAHAQVLSDLRLEGLWDAEELIRTRYILRGSSTPEVLLELLLSLSSREFEFFVARLYSSMGYTTTVTPAQKDGGKDVVARNGNETVFIECKNWRGRVDSDVVAGLSGRVGMARVTRGVIVGTSGFTSGYASATELAAQDPNRMQLISGKELIVLCNEHLGSEWHRRIGREIDAEGRNQILTR